MRRVPLFWISIVFVMGIFCAQVFMTGPGFWKSGLLIAFVFVVLERSLLNRWNTYRTLQGRTPLAPGLLILCFFLGGLRYEIATLPPNPTDLSYYNNHGKVILDGIICDDPQRKENSMQLIVCVDSITLENKSSQSVKGKAILRLQPADWHYGERVLAIGSIINPPEEENFSYRFYLSTRGIHTLMEYPYLKLLDANQGNWLKSRIFQLRHRAYQTVNDILPQPEAGLLSGILLGMENDIPYELEVDFQETGTAHIVAISGYNMTLLAGLVLVSFRRRFSFWWAGLLAILTITLYTILVGASPPVVRAALMSSLVMSAQLIGRKQAGLFTLMFTVAAMCAFNPLYLWDTGFQLSAMATLGLVLYATRLSTWFEKQAGRWLPEAVVQKIKGPVGEYFLFTLAAQVTTLPVIIFSFEQIPVMSLITNPLILPVQPLVMILGGIAVIIGLFVPPLGQLLAYLVWLPLAFTIKVVMLLAQIPGGVIPTGKVSLPFILIFYALLFLFTIPNEYLPKISGIRKQALAGLCLLATTMLVWNNVLTRTNGLLHVVVFGDPNQGVILIQTPTDKNVIINSGSRANALSAALNPYLPVLNRRLDLAVFSQEQKAQNQAFPVIIQRFPTDMFLWAKPDPQNSTSDQIANLLLSKEINSQTWETGVEVNLGDGVYLTKIDQNERGAILLLEYGKLRIFFGAEDPHQLEAGEPLTGAVVVLPPGEHNLQPWQEFQLITAIHHQQDDTFGVSTWQNGTIQFRSDGETLWLAGERAVFSP